jgi:hypothetical protein
MAVIANVALTNTFDTWRTRTNVGFTRLNAFTINESSLYANTLTANVAFTAKGTATVTGLFTASGRATVGTNLTVSGNTTFGGANKTSNTTGWFGVAGRASVSTNLHVAGNTNIGGTLTVSKAASQIVVSESTTGFASFSRKAPTGQACYDFYTINNLEAARITVEPAGWYVSTGTGVTTQFLIAPSGAVNIYRSATINNNLTVSGNTTLNGTTTDRSNALNQTLTDAATISWDVSSGRVATVTLGASRTIAAPTNQKVGTYILRVIQGGSGSYTLTWNGNYKWTAQTAPVLSTAVGAVDIITFFSDGTKMYGSYLPDMR